MSVEPLVPARGFAMPGAGSLPNATLLDWLERQAATRPDGPAVIAYRHEPADRCCLTYAELKRKADRAALGLAALGVQVGDVVSFQLPNWWQFVVLHLACVRVGAVSNPLMPIFRERELAFMLRFARSKLLVVPHLFRGFDYPAMVKGLRADLPDLRQVLVVDGGGDRDFERLLLDPKFDAPGALADLTAARSPDPDRVVQLMYTSGTTGQPKGAMHTSNTLLGGVHAYIDALGLSSADICYMASPLAHQTGFMYGLMLPMVLGTRLVLQDIWNADSAWPVFAREKVTFTMAATPFLSDLNGSSMASHYHDGTFRLFMCGGAPIPQVLLEQVTEKLAIHAIAGWGMTELGVVTATRPGDPMAKIVGTDGRALAGMEVRVVGDDGRPLPLGEEGDLQARGIAKFVGYLNRPDLAGTDPEGWFDTGDIARMDKEGYIRICGRSKDIIIRGGENVPVAEVEEVLYRHPAVQDAAVVAMPDPRLGERGCAFVVLKQAASFDFAALQAQFAAAGMAKQFWPERLEVLTEMPRTASGKIQKFELRERAGRLRPV